MSPWHLVRSVRWVDWRGLISETGPHRHSAPHRTSSRRAGWGRDLVGLSLRQCAPRCRGAPCSLPHRDRIQAYTRRRRHAVPARPTPHLVVVESSGVVPKIDLSAQCAPRPRRAPRVRSHRGVRRGLPEGRTSVAGAEAPTTSTSLIPRCTSWSSSRYGLPEGALASLAPHVSVKAITVGPGPALPPGGESPRPCVPHTAPLEPESETHAAPKDFVRFCDAPCCHGSPRSWTRCVDSCVSPEGETRRPSVT